jgi:hypothetical protein
MILYEGGEDIPTRPNTSNVYCNGSTHKTNNWGTITVIAQESKYYTSYKNGRPCKNYKYFIVQFEDGTKTRTQNDGILSGGVENPNKPSVFGMGFPGQGKCNCYENGQLTKEYTVWYDMFRRCYCKKTQKKHPTYKDCAVDIRWHNFQLFCEDIQTLEGYDKWYSPHKEKQNPYEIDKDIETKGNKVYSKCACKFVLAKENCGRYNKKQNITGLTYIATRIIDEYTENFTNQTEFAEKYGIPRHRVQRCCSGRLKEVSGWEIQST